MPKAKRLRFKVLAPHMSEDIRTSETQNCGTCRHSYNNDWAVMVRLGCWKGHVGFDSFALPHDFRCQGKDWQPKERRP